jgi:hypothetical protein
VAEEEAAPAATPQNPTASDLFVQSYETGDGDFNPEVPAAPVQAAAEPAAVSSPAPAPALPASLLRRAKENCGFDDGEIAEMTQPELERVVLRVEQQLLRQQRESQRANSVLNAVNQPQVEPTGFDTPQPAAPQPPVPEVDEFADFDPDEAHPVIVKLVNRVKALDAEVKSLRGLKVEFAQEKQRRADETFSQQCDRFFAGSPEVYGDGDFRAVKPGTPERMKRAATIATAAKFKTGSWEEKLTAAHEALWGPRQIQSPVPEVGAPARQLPPRGAQGRFERPDPLQQAIEAQYRDAALARPTQREAPELPPGREKAIQTASRLMNHMTSEQSNGSADDANADDFPD